MRNPHSRPPPPPAPLFTSQFLYISHLPWGLYFPPPFLADNDRNWMDFFWKKGDPSCFVRLRKFSHDWNTSRRPPWKGSKFNNIPTQFSLFNIPFIAPSVGSIACMVKCPNNSGEFAQKHLAKLQCWTPDGNKATSQTLSTQRPINVTKYGVTREKCACVWSVTGDVLAVLCYLAVLQWQFDFMPKSST